jgi:hypothetical protein
MKSDACDSIHVVDKYLRHYAEPFLSIDYFANHTSFPYVLVIPAYREGQSFVESLQRFCAKQKEPVLVIVVVNGPDNQTDARRENSHLLYRLKACGQVLISADQNHLIQIGASSVLIIGPLILPHREGVGRARKIGCDVALALMRKGIIDTPLLFVTDADAKLPADYCTRGRAALLAHPDCSCLIFPFVHERPHEPKQRRAIELYELRLAHYVSGLAQAASPYAFHTIGSTLAINALSYAQVRGFPKRSAGEDFYILNKLAKVGTIKQLSGKEINLSARLSTRVPFGTGPALITILEHGNAACIFYHPQVFVHLRGFLADYVALLSDQPVRHDVDFDRELCAYIFKSFKGAELLEKNLRSRRTINDRLRAFHDWFDAFRTLKFIHTLRDRQFPMCSFDEVCYKLSG